MRLMTRNLVGIALIAMVLALPTSAWAQAATSNITGRATDSSGGALPGVTVSVTSPNLIGGARTAVTDDQGLYRITLLPSGNYTVKFELPGFTILNIEGVDLNARHDDDDQRQAGGRVAAGDGDRYQPRADHRPRSGAGRRQLGSAEAR